MRWTCSSLRTSGSEALARSSVVMLELVHMPWRSGLPSGVRGGDQACWAEAEAASAREAAPAAKRRRLTSVLRPDCVVINEIDQKHTFARPMFGDFQEIDQAREAGPARQGRCHIFQPDLLHRRHFDLAGRKTITPPDPDPRIAPDAHAARHLAAFHRFAKALGELHGAAIFSATPHGLRPP